jgi:hypothetical protein
MLLLIKLARFAILCTIGIGAVLLVMEAAGGSVSSRPGILTERTTMTLLCVIGAEVVAAIAALTCLAFWRK